MSSRRIVVALLVGWRLAPVGHDRAALAQVAQAGAAAAAKTRDTSAAKARDTSTALPRPTPSSLNVSFELGDRAFVNGLTNQQQAKFTEYKDMPGGAVLQQLGLAYLTPDSSRQFQFVGRRIGALDQSLWLRGEQPGLFDFNVRSDRILHTFSTDARALGSETSPGVYVLPNPRPDTATLNHSPYLGPIRTIWDPVKLSVIVTPTTNWDMKAEYTHIDKNGGRPMGMAFGGSSSNAREIVEPIDQTVQGFRLTQSYAQPRFQLLGTYDLSLFANALSSVTSDNPLLVTDNATTGASRGRTALAPSNVAHTVAGTGALSLPFATRLTSSASYGWWRQNQPFIAPTINSVIVDPRMANEPQSLDGDVQTSMFSSSLSSRPFAPVNITAHYRSYVYRDHAANTVVPLLIVNDRSISPADSGERDPFRKDNADVGLTWHLPGPFALSGTYGWERMNLDSAVRNIGRYTETSPRANLDFTGLSWATLRTSYSKAWRRADEYHQTLSTLMPQFQRFDLSDRDRERFNVEADVTPIDPLTVSGMWQAGHDRYPGAAYGVQSDKNSAAGVDVSLAFDQRVTVGAGYSRESYDDLQQSRYRTGTQLTNLTYDWFAHNADRVNTTSANATFVIIPDRLEAGGTFELSHSRFLMAAWNPQTPTGGTAAQNTSATAVTFPEVTQTLQPLTASLRYHLTPEWALTVRYQAELYGQNDFRTLGLLPATGNFIFLGNNFENYNARYFTISMSYHPWPIRFGRSTL